MRCARATCSFCVKPFNFLTSTMKFSQILKMSTATFVEILLAILLPPLGVFLKFGCKVEFWICLILTLFGYLPGILYALYIITKD
ncbi:unnamed protein product [Eruca vesicaria subsp. sativa]|nr:unnamed protein product [Eruca vesicaria subsp. sativa]